jgi:rhodanese-related sulfurtransferase
MTIKIPERIPIPDLKKKLDSAKKPIVVDVREAKEIAESGVIPGSRHIPIGKLESHMDELPKTVEIVFYCGGGGRASRAAQTFADAGYKNVSFCGLRSWKQEGLPVVDKPQS